MTTDRKLNWRCEACKMESPSVSSRDKGSRNTKEDRGAPTSSLAASQQDQRPGKTVEEVEGDPQEKEEEEEDQNKVKVSDTNAEILLMNMNTKLNNISLEIKDLKKT